MDFIEIRKFLFYKNECDARILMWHVSLMQDRTLSFSPQDIVFILYVFPDFQMAHSLYLTECEWTRYYVFYLKKFKTVFEFTKKKYHRVVYTFLCLVLNNCWCQSYFLKFNLALKPTHNTQSRVHHSISHQLPS